MPGVECIELIDVDRRPLQVAVSPFYSLLMATRDAAGACRSETPESWCRAIRVHLTARDYELLAPLAPPRSTRSP